MYNEDRYHTTSWDGREVQRQMQPDGSSRQQDPFHPAPAKKKNKKKSNAEAAAKPSKAVKPAYQHISYKGQKKQKAQQKAAAEAADTVVQLVEEEQA